MATVKIGSRLVGEGQAPFVVAEVGINHNGELDKAFKMIEVAKAAGADCVKFQTFKADEFVGDPALLFTYKSQGKEVTESMLEMFRRYEFSKESWKKIKHHCDETGILFLSTPQNYSDLELLLELGVTAVKIGSDDFTNIPLLKSYAQTKLPLIVSCGMSNLAEVHQALDSVGALDGYPTILLLCTSQYPTPAADVNLRKLNTLANSFPMVPVGLSDHTQGPMASALAVACGASFFEKHFTLSRDLPGPDHWFSEEPESLKQWVASIHLAHSMMGTAIVRATKAEEAMKTLARRSVVALKDLNEGDRLNSQNVGLRRPGNGLPPSMLESILGLSATHSVPKGRPLKLGDFK